jgi:hypothetical protein
MASELRVDTLKDSSGNNSVGMAYVAEGSAKAWCNLDGTSATAASDLTGVRDSLNISAVVDNGVGDYTYVFSNAMLNSNYAVKGTVQNTTYPVRVNSLQPTTYAASSISVNCITNNASYGSLFDQDYVNTALLGDLA